MNSIQIEHEQNPGTRFIPDEATIRLYNLIQERTKGRIIEQKKHEETADWKICKWCKKKLYRGKNEMPGPWKIRKMHPTCQKEKHSIDVENYNRSRREATRRRKEAKK